MCCTLNLSWALQYEWYRGLEPMEEIQYEWYRGLEPMEERFGSVCITAPFPI